MTTNEARNVFNQMVEEAAKNGNHETVAKIELAREFFTNPDFRKALEQHVWELNQEAGR